MNNTLKRIFSLPMIFSILMVGRILGGIGELSIAFLVGCIALNVFILLYLFVRSQKVNYDKLLLFFILYLVVNILISNIDPIFRIWPRFGLFALLLMLCSSLFQDNIFRQFRKKCLYYTLWLLVAIGSISFICYFLGINLFEDRNYGGYLDEYEDIAGGFSGITAHSMLLGPCAALGACFMFAHYVKMKKLKYLLLTIMCIGSVFFAASRAAFVGMVVGMVVTLFVMSNNRKVFFKSLLGIFALALITFPIWMGSLTLLQQKQEGHSQDGLLQTRSGKFEERAKEFISSPIVGIGYQTVSLKAVDAPNESGNIEPGTSWLAVLSMTGAIGFIFFLLIICQSINSIRNKIQDLLERGWLLGILTFFIVNMLVEGYIFAGGSTLCYFLWLTIGTAKDFSFNTNVKLKIE